jgi:DHA2 family multidrug resistance protein-like MFS transporter
MTSPAPRKWATLAICCLAALVPNIDLTALNLAIPHLITDLHPSATQILWIADMYGFALAGLLITMGSIGDRIGHKRLLLIGGVTFSAASALTAYSSSAALLIGARALLGIAGATLMPSALSLIRRAFTAPKERTTAVGIFSGIGALGVGLGPIIGGVLLDHFWWGSVFLINVPIMALICLAGLFVLSESHSPNPRRLDFLGVPLSIVGMLGIVYTIKEAALGHIEEPRVLLALVVGIAGIAAFLWRQSRLAEPLIDIRLFRRAAFSGSIGTNLFAMFALVAQSLIFSEYFQQVLGWSPLKSGLAGMPGAVFAMVGGGVAAPLIGLFGRARVVALGLVLSAVGFSLYGLAGTSSDYPILLVALFPSALGVGMALTVTGDTILASVPRERSGAASAISETATELGGALGLAVLGSVLNGMYRSRISLPAGLSDNARGQSRDSLGGALNAGATMPGRLAGDVVGAARHAFVDGMHVALWCSGGFAAVVGITALYTLRSVPKVINDEEPERELVAR